MQFQKLFPDAVIKPVRGNVLTRLEKLDRGEYGALLLAEAGLIRLGLAERISYRFSPNEMVPAAGQGIMAIQTRAGEYAGLLRQLNHEDAAFCAGTERRLSGLLGGDCSAPVGCYAKLHGDDFMLYGFSGIDGTPRFDKVQGKREDAEALVQALAAQLSKKVSI